MHLPHFSCCWDRQTSNGLALSGMLDTWFYENVASGLRRKVTGFEQVTRAG